MEPEYEYTSFEYMDDLWRFDLDSEQWENIEVYGIASIRREIYLWNGTSIFTDVSSQNKLKKDLNNINIKQLKNLEPGESIELPTPRGGHSMTVCGNPPDYILIFGGVTQEVI